MNKIAIMTDTNSGITPSCAEQNGIYLLKMPFTINGEEYLEYGDLSYDEFFEALETGAEVFTSQPSPSALTDMWDRLLESYENVIYIPMSSALSGTYSTAKILAADYNNKVFVVDNKRISVSLSCAVFDAIKMAKQGFCCEEIVEKLEKNALNASIYITVSTLEYLKKSGRVTSAGAAIGSILGIKPVLQINGEKLDAYKKVRGMKAALDTMLEAADNDLKTFFKDKKFKIFIAYSGKKDTACQWLETLREHYPQYQVEMAVLPISISCHTGPDALGIGIIEII